MKRRRYSPESGFAKSGQLWAKAPRRRCCSARCAGMNRIVERFARLKKEGKKGFIVYIGAGDPNLEATRRLALAFDEAGVDILELGVPFSDPLADGLVNQLAAQRGLESGTTPSKVMETEEELRKRSQI